MISNNPFFKKRKKIYLYDILKILNIKELKSYKNTLISDIKNLDESLKNNISFLHSARYKNDLKSSNSNYIITTNNLSKFIPNSKNQIVVKNVLTSVAKITELFYPDSLEENFEDKFVKTNYKKKYKQVKFGENVILGENVKIGKNSSIGHNTIIESNVIIGNYCKIGSNVIIKKAIISNNVSILDGAIIGKKGFGFFPSSNGNIRYPHIGMVIIGNNVEIGCKLEKIVLLRVKLDLQEVPQLVIML